MKSLISMKEAVKVLKDSGAAITKFKNELNARIREIESEGRSEKWTRDAIASIREQVVTKAAELLNQVYEVKKKIDIHQSFWTDKFSVLASMPITDRDASNLSPANPFSEAMTRMSILTEAKLLSTGNLEQAAKRAIAAGELGKAYLYSLEGGSRVTTAKIDLSGVQIKEQDAGLEVIKEANIIIGNATVEYQEISGRKPFDLVTSRMTVARGGSAG